MHLYTSQQALTLRSWDMTFQVIRFQYCMIGYPVLGVYYGVGYMPLYWFRHTESHLNHITSFGHMDHTQHPETKMIRNFLFEKIKKQGENENRSATGITYP